MELLVALGKSAYNLKIEFFKTLISLVAFFIALHWGIIAIAFSFLISSIFVFPFSLIQINSLISINFIIYFKQYISSIIGLLVMTSLVMIVKNNINSMFLPYEELILYGVFSMIIYLVVILILEPNLIRRLIQTFKSSSVKP